MRALKTLAVGALASAALATSAAAATLEWQGTLSLPFRTLPSFEITGTGVATVNGSGGWGHLSTLRLAGGLTGIATVPITDPENSHLLTATVRARLGTGTFAAISGGEPLTSNALPVPGGWKICVLFPGCGNYLVIPFTGDGTRGVGVGGTVTIFSKGISGPAFTLAGAPWTIGVASVTGVSTANGGTATLTAAGFAHGPASATSSTAALSGVVQFVTPVRAKGLHGIYRSDFEWVPPFVKLRLRFIPEPGLSLLLGSGVADLLLLARRRARSS
jgi:hypothetical protein